MHRARLILAATAIAAIAGLPFGSPALAVASARPSDFNGDGFADLAIGSIYEDQEAGGVTVLFGSANGVTSLGSQRWSQASPGIKGDPDTDRAYDGSGEHFGARLASGDFDRDGFADLAATVPGDWIGGVESAGSVSILYGTRRGLTADRDQRWSRANLPGKPQVGSAVAAGDFDNDGFADLAIHVLVDGTLGVQLLYGGASGLSAARTARVTRADAGGTEPSDVTFGIALAAGDLDGDRYADLAVGAPDYNCLSSDCVTDGGEVGVFYGGPRGLVADGERWDQDSPGILDTDETNDRFGDEMAIGDFDGDGFGDLAVGASGESIAVQDDGFPGEGAVAILRGSAGGITSDGNRLLHEGVPGIPDDPEAVGLFGSALAAGDLDGDGRDDLAIGAKFDDVGGETQAGSVTVLYGTASGIGVDRAQWWTQATPGVPGAPSDPNEFGTSLAIADYGRTDRADLAIGAPGERTDGVWRSGSVTVLFGRGSGLTTTGVQRWSQASPGVPGAPERYDSFGASLSH